MNIEDRDVHLVNFNVSHTYSFYLYNCFMLHMTVLLHVTYDMLHMTQSNKVALLIIASLSYFISEYVVIKIHAIHH